MRRALAAVRPRLAASRRGLATAVRLTLAEIVVPVAVATAAGLAPAATISPRWRAAGRPYLLSYAQPRKGDHHEENVAEKAGSHP
jgi:hypothetical protein